MGTLSAPILWLILLVIFVVVEIATVGLVTIWFAGGAIAAFFASMAGAGTMAQIIVFLIVSLVLLMLVRPLARKHFNNSHVATNAQMLIGQRAVVLEEIDNLKAQGCVMVNGQEWTARSAQDGETFAKDDVVEIAAISGVKLMVKQPES